MMLSLAVLLSTGACWAGDNVPPIVSWMPSTCGTRDTERHGLNYAYYEASITSVTQLSNYYPLQSGWSQNGIDISQRRVNDRFGFRFTGYVIIPTTGSYTFYTRSDDGSRLWINNTLVVDNDGLHGAQDRSGTITLTTGMASIMVEYFELTGGEICEVSWTKPGGVREPLAADMLRASVDHGPLFHLAQPQLRYEMRVQESLQVTAVASDADQSVASVAFLIDDIPYGVVETPPYRVTIADLAPGRHTLRALATDAVGATGVTEEITIDVLADMPMVYDGLDGETAAINDQYTGWGWGDSWYTQNDDADPTGYRRHADGLTYLSLATAPGCLVGGKSYLSLGRRLDVGSASPLSDVSDANGLLGKPGARIWLSFLVRRDTTDTSELRVVWHNNPISWYMNAPGISFGTFGSTSTVNGVQHWTLRLGGTSYWDTGVPVTRGESVFVVMRVDFAADATAVACYVNPTSLGGPPPSQPTVSGQVAPGIALRSLHFYGGNDRETATLDEIRLGSTYASVTPVSMAPIGLTLSAPARSRVSPVSVEGTEPLGVGTQMRVNGGGVGVRPLATGRFYANVPLEPGVSNTISVTHGEAEVVRTVTWEETDLASHPTGLAIRRGDSLLLRAPPGSTLVQSDGYEEVVLGTFSPSGLLIADFYNPGSFTLLAVDGAGVALGSLGVRVVGYSARGATACEVGYERVKRVSVLEGRPGDVYVTRSEEKDIDVRQAVFGDSELILGVRPLRLGMPRMVARLGHTLGPILSVDDVDEFRVWLTSERKFSVTSTYPDGTRVGQAAIILSPWLPDIDGELWTQTSGVSFLDSGTRITYSSNQFRVFGSLYEGMYQYQIVIAPSTTNRVCHGYRLFQSSAQISR
jgi:hypothetical protein